MIEIGSRVTTQGVVGDRAQHVPIPPTRTAYRRLLSLTFFYWFGRHLGVSKELPELKKILTPGVMTFILYLVPVLNRE